MCQDGRDIKLSMKENKLLYINLALFVGIIWIIIVWKMAAPARPKEGASREPSILKQRAPLKSQEVIYDISKIKQERIKTFKEAKDLNEMYMNFSKGDVGDNMVEAWAKVKAEDKAKFIGVLDKKIETSKTLLKANPQDKKTKGMLFISESLKNMALNNFNYKIAEYSANAREKSSQVKK